MTKARDLANAATALNAVTATELGYVDGVTSAIQTQIDSKIAKSTLTAKGDLIVATGSGTLVNQSVGTDGQVLTANSAQADGVEWATPATGMTLLSTTSLSGTSTSVSVTPTGYKNLVAYIYGGTAASGNFNYNVQINGITSATYLNMNSSFVAGGSLLNTGGNTSAIDLNQPGNISVASGGLNSFNLTFWDCNSSEKKNVTVNGSYINMSAANTVMENRVSVLSATSAITNITVIANAALTGGTIQVYGVK